MPQTSIVQNPGVQWEEKYYFPQLLDTDVAPFGFAAGGTHRGAWSDGFMARDRTGWDDFPGAVQVAGGGAASIEGGGQLRVDLSGAAAGDRWQSGFGMMRGFFDDGSGAPLAPGAEMNFRNRVWRLFMLVRSPGAPTNGCGMVVMPTNNRNTHGWPGNPVGPANRGGFGLVGDGAGQWVFQSYDRTGVFSVRDTIVLPAHTITDWNLFELVVINARPATPATVEIWWNGNQLGARSWAAGQLEPYAANEWSFVPTFRVLDANSWSFKELVMMRGRFDRQGLAV